MKNVLIIGFFGHENLGDDLLFVESLAKYPQAWNLVVLGNKEKLERFKVLRDFDVITGIKKIVKQKFDLAVFSGGGQFPSRNFSYRDFLSKYILLFSSKKYILNGVGIVPKNKKFHKFLFSLFLRHAKYVSVRDNTSLNFVLACNLKNAINVGDLYWGNNSSKISSCLITKRYEKIALICLAQPFSFDELMKDHYKKRYDTFLYELSKAIHNIEDLGFTLYFIPFYKKSDSILLKNLNKLYPINKKRILQEGKHFSLTEIDSLFAQADFGLLMRFHSKLLAIKNSLPFVGICYDYKSQTLLEECSIPEVGLKYGIRKSDFFGEEVDFSSKEIIEKMNYVLSNSSNLQKKMNKFATLKKKTIIENYKKIGCM